MYEVIKKAETFGLNKVFLNSREFVNVIEEMHAKKDDMLISELIKETLKDELLKDKDITYVNSTTTYVDDISTQKKILKAVG